MAPNLLILKICGFIRHTSNNIFYKKCFTCLWFYYKLVGNKIYCLDDKWEVRLFLQLFPKSNNICSKLCLYTKYNVKIKMNNLAEIFQNRINSSLQYLQGSIYAIKRKVVWAQNWSLNSHVSVIDLSLECKQKSLIKTSF